MSPRLGTYSFLPWLRQGLANEIRESSIPAGSSRATIDVALQVSGTGGAATLTETVTRAVPLYGPGDVIAIDRRAIVRTEPRDRITNFESNYLPYIEFYDEDFPWRYSPEPAFGHRLRPWLALVVLKEDEFSDIARTRERPLPCISVDAPESVFPSADQLWAWSHVHVNRDLGATEDQIVTTDMNAVLPKLESALRSNADLGYSRLLCPRRLDVSTTYHAFVIPAYESGRRAGLGIDPAGTPATHASWGGTPGPQPNLFPYYYRWSFITATYGDFEYLVRLLEPRPVDNRVGRRDIDVQEPGSNLRGITDPVLAGVLRLGGALRVPLDTMSTTDRAEYDQFNEWDRTGYPKPFQHDLAAFINLTDDYSEKAAETANADSDYDASIPDADNPGGTQTDPDPLITPPLYGRWHALTERLLNERDGSPVEHNRGWVHQLNLDPRHRVAAAFGTEVVQRNQEDYMEAAWEQVGDVLAANDRIRTGQFSKFVAQTWHVRTLMPLAAKPAQRERALAIAAPVQARVLSDGVTLHQRVAESTLPRALLTPQARRVLRPAGRLIRLSPFDAQRTPGNLLERTNAGEVTANPPKPPLKNAPTLEDIADAAQDAAEAEVPPIVRTLLERFPWIVAVVLVLALWLRASGVLMVPVFAFLYWLWRRLRSWRDAMQAPTGLRPETRTPATVDDLPTSPDFRIITDLDDTFRPSANGADSTVAVRYKQALRDAYRMEDAARKASVGLRPNRKPLDLRATVNTLVAAVEPAVTIPRHIKAGINIPHRIRDQQTDDFVEVRAYPVIDLPMYKPLVELSEENFLPNLNLIEQNTISLLETNRRFIEAYMVGINHEWSRELLWREYPTDQRGSTFRQFWDPSAFLDDGAATPEQQRERLRDIPPLHRWTKPSELGSHNHRQTSGPAREDLVLVIRGELLKRYPNAVIYAHRARWQMRNGEIARDLPRVLDDLGVADNEAPPRTKVRTPLYEARIDPDITFFGFDITAEEALGDPDGNDVDRAGWFFIIKERPGEPRFGLDLGGGETLYTWNDLGWDNVAPGSQPGDMLEITATSPEIALVTPPSSAGDDLRAQAQDDRAVRWHRGMDAAELAYILYQVPVLVAVHAAEMLPRKVQEE